MANLTLTTFFYIALGGILPAVVWLWFWLHEDSKKPEPKRLIIATFLAGGIATLPAFLIERMVADHFGLPEGLLLFAIWAFIEEGLKLGAALLSGEGSRSYDEPIDSMVYLITAALGFAAFENIFFLLHHQSSGTVLNEIFLSGNLRFLGANILHAVTSGIAGGIMAFAFYKSRSAKICAGILGLITATLLHTLFNALIIQSDGGRILITFAGFWFAAALLILLFERVRKISSYYA